MQLNPLENIKFLLILFTLFFSNSCSNQSNVIEIENEEEEIKSIKYLALGDSYTIGQGVDETQRWPDQLAEQLEENDFKIEVVDIIARTGWTTKNLIDSIESTDLENYNLVSLLIGVNNQFQRIPFEIFRSELDTLLDKSIAIAGSKERVFVVSIPDYGVTPFGSGNSVKIAEEIDMYNSYTSDVCADRNIPFINITEISRNLEDSPDALAPDNLHPSGSQYAEWVTEILPVVIEILNE